jgi:HAE1 family hydrophobic/amphiphilic exporter-1
VSIPLSVLIALIAMWVQGLSLNILTLGALTIAIGRVVDDSIVVLENIKRHLEYGEEKVAAIAQATREVAGAITASTLTTVAVFLPITLVGGTVGELFRPFALTVTVALLASLLVALTIVPVFGYWFLKQPQDLEHPEQVRALAEEKERRSVLQRVYVPVIRFAVKRRWSTIAISVVILIATLAMAPLLKTNFLDQSGQTTMNVTQTLPVGTSLKATDAAAEQVEDVLAEEKGAGRLVSYQTTIGGGQIPGLGGNSNNARYSLTVPDGTDINAYTDDLTKKLNALSGAGDVKIGGGNNGFGSSNLQVVVQGPDTETIAGAAEQIRKQMATISGLKDVTTDLAEQTPRIQVSAKPEAAASYGLSGTALGGLVASAFRGIPAGQVSLGGVQQNIVVTTGTAPTDVDAVKALVIPTARGPVPLSTVADVTEAEAQAQITRIDGARSATVEGTPTGDNLGAASAALTQKLKDLKLPAGATYTVGGATSDQSEAFSQLGLALLAAIVIVFVVMVGTFRSLIQPLILLVSIPFAATGALLSLLITNTPLGVPALIGMLMLVGIVVTNAIVLLDLINQYRREGRPLDESVIEGGRHRLRPILMTACATIFALLPMAIGLTASGGFISQPLAVVVIGGLTTSTLLTLVLVPALYTMAEGSRDRRATRRERRRAKREGRAADAEALPVS